MWWSHMGSHTVVVGSQVWFVKWALCSLISSYDSDHTDAARCATRTDMASISDLTSDLTI